MDLSYQTSPPIRSHRASLRRRQAMKDIFYHSSRRFPKARESPQVVFYRLIVTIYHTCNKAAARLRAETEDEEYRLWNEPKVLRGSRKRRYDTDTKMHISFPEEVRELDHRFEKLSIFDTHPSTPALTSAATSPAASERLLTPPSYAVNVHAKSYSPPSAASIHETPMEIDIDEYYFVTAPKPIDVPSVSHQEPAVDMELCTPTERAAPAAADSKTPPSNSSVPSAHAPSMPCDTPAAVTGVSAPPPTLATAINAPGEDTLAALCATQYISSPLPNGHDESTPATPAVLQAQSATAPSAALGRTASVSIADTELPQRSRRVATAFDVEGTPNSSSPISLPAASAATEASSLASDNAMSSTGNAPLPSPNDTSNQAGTSSTPTTSSLSSTSPATAEEATATRTASVSVPDTIYSPPQGSCRVATAFDIEGAPYPSPPASSIDIVPAPSSSKSQPASPSAAQPAASSSADAFGFNFQFGSELNAKFVASREAERELKAGEKLDLEGDALENYMKAEMGLVPKSRTAARTRAGGAASKSSAGSVINRLKGRTQTRSRAAATSSSTSTPTSDAQSFDPVVGPVGAASGQASSSVHASEEPFVQPSSSSSLAEVHEFLAWSTSPATNEPKKWKTKARADPVGEPSSSGSGKDDEEGFYWYGGVKYPCAANPQWNNDPQTSTSVSGAVVQAVEPVNDQADFGTLPSLEGGQFYPEVSNRRCETVTSFDDFQYNGEPSAHQEFVLMKVEPQDPFAAAGVTPRVPRAGRRKKISQEEIWAMIAQTFKDNKAI